MKKCDKSGHTRVYYSNGKSDCYQCKLASAAKSRAKPENRLRKNLYEAKRRQMPGYKEELAEKHRLRKYGIKEKPTGLCEICRAKPATVVDHDHESGQFRGFLCRICNVWLAVYENKMFMANAAEYVKNKVEVSVKK